MANLENSRVTEIISLHNEIIGHFKICLEKAIRIGELLVEQKKALQHGKFGKWIEANLPFTDRTAQRYMKIHKERDKLKSDTVSDLTSAYKLLERGVERDGFWSTMDELQRIDGELERINEVLTKYRGVLAKPIPEEDEKKQKAMYETIKIIDDLTEIQLKQASLFKRKAESMRQIAAELKKHSDSIRKTDKVLLEAKEECGEERLLSCLKSWNLDVEVFSHCSDVVRNGPYWPKFKKLITDISNGAKEYWLVHNMVITSYVAEEVPKSWQWKYLRGE